MILKNTIYEDYGKIRSQYNGYCVFVARYEGDPVEPDGGEVLAYHKSLAELIKEVRPLIKKGDIGEYTFMTFTDFADSSVIQVVPHEN